MQELLKSFNLFKSIPRPTDEHDIQNELISTYCYTALLIVSVTVLMFYMSFFPVTQTVTIKSPSIDMYTQLYKNYSQTLLCPCSTLAIPFEIFIHFYPTYHQICSSHFVMDKWFKYVQSWTKNNNVYTTDFHYTGSNQFQMLQSLCQLINLTIKNALMVFYLTNYISSTVISRQLFEVET
ncbi:unnamed protein product [Didymodactylos carnosus]|uniref:Uncharacterized protein n=2 Tax=Didymodactylos carnosus TaxID=1234261 RepID=A0A8S2FM90_9BILA|nr:unnamed protein product [Didymodactylos carnosus]CAF4299935.1 unnamed protein product [Didymodactylos carnosus]